MKDLLKFLTCGSVDDGKSTLIGRLLADAHLLMKDQEANMEEDDYASLLDGLTAEREQGITIDVAYRYFTTEKRSFIVADTPGHEQYTRNMAVGASFANLAVLLIDANIEVMKVQTYRHSRICKMMGINYFVFAVNKMDEVSYSKEKFNKIETMIQSLCEDLKIEHVLIIPLSAKYGDNVVHASKEMPWYKGPTLLNYLEEVDVLEDKNEEAFILPIQRVCRPDSQYRGYEGEIMRGSLSVGDIVKILPTGEKSMITSLLWAGKPVEMASEGMPVSVTIEDDIDISRGDVLVRHADVSLSSNFSCKLIWMADEALSTGKTYYLKLGTSLVPVKISNVLYREDIETGDSIPNETIQKNDIAVVEINAMRKLALTLFEKEESLGRFLLIDRIHNGTVAAGVITDTTSTSNHLTWQETSITKELRATSLNQKPITIWMTGLSGAGKSALANELEVQLQQANKHTMLPDGDNIRLGLNRDLRFKESDRSENIRRIAEVAKLMNDAGLIVLTAFISPFEEDRQKAKDIIGEDAFCEVYVSTPIEVCEERDVKGLYKKARSGAISNFTGVNSPFEIPEKPTIVIDMSGGKIEDAAKSVLEQLKEKGFYV